MLKNYSKIEVDENGYKRYLNNEGEQHRLDGPAVEFKDGSKFWHINGNCHRNIDPSDEYGNGSKYWLFKDKHHRIGGSFASYRECWRINDEDYDKQDYFNKVWDI